MTTGHANVRDTSDTTFARDVIERSHHVPVVVDFWAAWCGPCRMLGPILEQLAADSNGAWELVKLDTDSNPRSAMQYRIQGIPAVKAFRDGQVVSEFTGALPEPKVRAWLRGVVPSAADQHVRAAAAAAGRGDAVEAERLYRAALADDHGHAAAGAGLAGLLLARGELAEAATLLSAAGNGPDIERMRALLRFKQAAGGGNVAELQARLAANPRDVAAHTALGQFLAADEAYTAALDHFLQAVTIDRKAGDTARRAMLDLFALLGEDDPRTRDYRSRLSSVLF